MVERPIACDMSALSAQERVHHGTLSKIVRSSIRDQVEIRDGYRFALDSSVGIARVGSWIELEARCCPFLQFAFEIGPGGSTTLSLTGPEGVREFIVGELPIAVTPC